MLSTITHLTVGIRPKSGVLDTSDEPFFEIGLLDEGFTYAFPTSSGQVRDRGRNALGVKDIVRCDFAVK